MKRVKIGTRTPKVEMIMPNLWKVRWDFKEDTCWEIEFPFKPTLETVKTVIWEAENALTDKKILEGFAWKGMRVWLSGENQFNYKAAFDLAVQTGGANLPLTFKFGDGEEPVYYEFKELDDLKDFYTSAMNHINQSLLSGWSAKDSIGWDDYAEGLC